MASPSIPSTSIPSFGGIIEAFKAALQRSDLPHIADYLPQPKDLIKLLHVEMEFRLKTGDRHPLVLLQPGNLAGMYRKQGDVIKAENMAREFVERIRRMPALRSQPIVVDGLMQYGNEVRQRRSGTEAEGLYREALPYARERPQGNEKNFEELEKRLTELQKKRSR